ncbi:hypothetical protein M3Y95_00383900 [Aphelenchoides besseyi]|nr:hypothetical protein M3Y95_00383900 [Aphelenchoides besseyi]
MVIDFSLPTHLRQFELVVDGGSLYVNPHYLAEISPYFNGLCFTNFREMRENRVHMEDVNLKEMHELLRCICPEDFTLENRITADNFAALIYLSQRFLLQNLRRELERLCGETDGVLDDKNIAMPNLVNVLVEATQADFSDSAVRELLRRVGKFKLDDVTQLLTKEFPIEIRDPLLKRLEPYFFQAKGICTERSLYNWNDMTNNIRLFF